MSVIYEIIHVYSIHKLVIETIINTYVEKLYSVAINGKNNLVVFDAEKGVRAYSINLGNVTILNGPIITKDKLTVVVKDVRGKTTAKVFSLKSGVLSYSFIVK